jgi:hypothetical protein
MREQHKAAEKRHHFSSSSALPQYLQRTECTSWLQGAHHHERLPYRMSIGLRGGVLNNTSALGSITRSSPLFRH